MLLKRLLILYSSVAITLLFAIYETNMKTVMNLKIQKITTLLQDEELDKDAKKDRVYLIVDSIFDYKVMSAIALGKNWDNLSDDLKKEFIKKFEGIIKDFYFEQLLSRSGQTVFISKIDKVKKNRIKLHTVVADNNTSNYEVVYKLYKQKNSEDWFVYDVNIGEMSILQTYHQKFLNFLKTNNIDELIKSLNTFSDKEDEV